MRVLIFGAGASKRAGYPLANELLDRVGESASESSSIQFRDAWQAWESFRESVPASLRLIAYNSNPEVVLSLPDLYHLAVESEDDQATTTAIRTFPTTGESSAEELEKYFDSGDREALSTARARARLLHALERYFGARHHEDRSERARRDYLHPILEPLSDGDVIITLNWDTIAKRTLAEADKWNPTNGYGFERSLLLEDPSGQTSPLPPAFPSNSPVKILKLHGSFGWRRTDHGVYLDSTMLLHEFGFYFAGNPIRLRDSDEPERYEPDPPLIAYPSFLKRLDHPTVDSIWRDASEALARAESLEVWGYSLPASDGAIRALLQTVSVRARRKELDVVVYDPSQCVLKRWKRLLGDGIQVRQESV